MEKDTVEIIKTVIGDRATVNPAEIKQSCVALLPPKKCPNHYVVLFVVSHDRQFNIWNSHMQK